MSESSSPPQSTLEENEQVMSMLKQLSWCMADSSPIKEQLRNFGLDPDSAQAVISALKETKNQHAITLLRKEKSNILIDSVGHYIKTHLPGGSKKNKNSHVNITVMLNLKNKQVEIIVKSAGERARDVSYSEGQFKRATKCVKLTLIDNVLTIAPVVAIKPKEDRYEFSVDREIRKQQQSTITCDIVSGPGKRIGHVRYFQDDGGKNVVDYIKTSKKLLDAELVGMAIQYVHQVGQQLNALHT